MRREGDAHSGKPGNDPSVALTLQLVAETALLRRRGPVDGGKTITGSALAVSHFGLGVPKRVRCLVRCGACLTARLVGPGKDLERVGLGVC